MPKKQKTSVEIAYIGFAISGDMNVIEKPRFPIVRREQNKNHLAPFPAEQCGISNAERNCHKGAEGTSKQQDGFAGTGNAGKGSPNKRKPSYLDGKDSKEKGTKEHNGGPFSLSSLTDNVDELFKK